MFFKSNSYIQNRALRTFFYASVFTSLMVQLNTTIDGIIVGHLVSPDALSAIGLVSPIIDIFVLLALILCTGSSTLVSKEIGGVNYKQAGRLFTVCILGILISYLFLTPLFYFNSDRVAGFLTKDERLLPFIYDYLPIAFLGGGISMILQSFHMFVKAAGNPKLVICSVLVQVMVNVLLDLTFVGLFRMGVKGSALATIISLLPAMAVYCRFFSKQECIYKMQRPNKDWFSSLFRDSIKTGIPAAVSAAGLAALMICLNGLILKAKGADGMFIISISMQMLMICMLILSGAGSAIIGIGGVLLGEKNVDGYRGLVTNILKKSTSALLLISLLLFLFPDIIARLFGASGNLLNYSIIPLRQMCLLFLPIGIMTLLLNAYVIQGHTILSSFISIGELIFILPVVWLSAKFFPQFIWVSIPIGVWILMFIMVLSTIIISIRNPLLHWFTLIPKKSDIPFISFSVPYNKDALENALVNISKFIDACKLSDELSYNIKQCVEAISYNIISLSEPTLKKGYFDIRIVDDSEYIQVIVKDALAPHNPISPKVENQNVTELIALCKDVTYSYMNSINCLYMKFLYRYKI